MTGKPSKSSARLARPHRTEIGPAVPSSSTSLISARSVPSSRPANLDSLFTTQGMSGRTLRRLPVLAHAKHIGMTTHKPKMEVWLRAMAASVKEEGEQMDKVEGKS